MNHIKPHFLVAADAIYHFGISRYSCQFRRDLEQFLEAHNALFIIPEMFYQNFVHHFKKFEHNTVPVPFTAQEINLAMKDLFEVKTLASSLCDQIYLLGFDGRKKTDKHFWGSTTSVNYEDLKRYHQEAHPGFFKGIDYQDYAQIQSDNAESIMALGEEMGKRYYSLNESTNLALQKRFYPQGKT